MIPKLYYFEKSSRLIYSITSGFAEVNHRQIHIKYQYQVSFKKGFQMLIYIQSL